MSIEKPRNSANSSEGAWTPASSSTPNFQAQLLSNAYTQDRLQECLAILSAISMGELLVATPSDPAAYERHVTAVSMISAVQVLLKDALRELED